MTYKFFFISAELAKKDPTTVGFAYAKLHESDWVTGPSDFNGIITVGVNKGIDNVIYENKAYQINRVYFGVDNNTILVLCVESVLGCDIKEQFDHE